MTTVYHKTPMARKEAWSYCRRCLAVMLCCVLVSSLTVRTAPRAKATAAVGSVATAIATSGGVAAVDMPGAATALLSLVQLGVDIDMRADEVFSEENVQKVEAAQRAGYKYGWQLDAYLRGETVDETAKTEWCSLVDTIKGRGGIVAGDSISISAGLAETIRQWAVANMGLADGALEYQDYVAFDAEGAFQLTVVDTTELDEYTSSRAKSFTLPLDHLGSCVGFPAIDFDASYSAAIALVNDLAFLVTYALNDNNVSASLKMTPNFYNGAVSANGSREGLRVIGLNNCETHEVLVVKLNEFVNEPNRAVLFYSPAKSRFYAGVYYPTLGKVTVTSTNYYDLTESQVPAKITTTITPRGDLATPVAKDVVISVPSDVPVTDVGNWSVPDIGSLTGEDLLVGTEEKVPPVAGTGVTAAEIEKAITDALPITGAIAGDQVVQDALAEPESLGAVFISKFPFSIPWDVVKAISLLAAPPVTPYWEIDFFSAMEGFNGFHARGDTTIVVDFERFEFLGQLCRWTSTLFFVYALALGTKRLIWTA